ncbi:MAG: hypothetical protein J5I53_05270 [Bradyrhizobiaceae bacterium]|nr:hypothetical protein [Bradyrhizobiaceae bacterium]
MNLSIHPKAVSELREFLESAQCLALVNEFKTLIGADNQVTPGVVQQVRKLLPQSLAEVSQGVMDILWGTLRAERLGKRRGEWLFTSRTAEQSTHPRIAEYHAQQLAVHAQQHSVHGEVQRYLVEIGTGSAADAAALCRHGFHVTSFEVDVVTALVAEANLKRQGLAVKVVNQEWNGYGQGTVGNVWADPARRTDAGRRIRSSKDYLPPLEQIVGVPSTFYGVIGIKVGPADEIDLRTSTMPVSREFIGFRNECREQVLWIGREIVPRTSATIIDVDGIHTLTGSASTTPAMDNHVHGTSARIPSSGMYLIEPHPAVIAAGLVDDVFVAARADAIDQHIAYGIANGKPPSSVFYERFAILEVHEGVRVKTLRDRLRLLGWSNATEIKKRGWPADPQELRKKLDLEAAGADIPFGVVIIARVGERHLTLLCERVSG